MVAVHDADMRDGKATQLSVEISRSDDVPEMPGEDLMPNAALSCQMPQKIDTANVDMECIWCLLIKVVPK